MKINKRKSKLLEADLTPMIDMTFLLIAFFMLIINFNETEKEQDLELPDTKIARPAEEPPDYKIIINMKQDKGDKVPMLRISGQDILGISALDYFLKQEIQSAASLAEPVSVSDIQVIIRADQKMPTGVVQELIAKCQASKLQKFALRAKEKLH